MKKIYALLTAVVVAGLFFNSCEKIRDFGDINKSPNSPSTAFTSYMFTQSQRYLYYFVTGSATNAYDLGSSSGTVIWPSARITSTARWARPPLGVTARSILPR